MAFALEKDVCCFPVDCLGNLRASGAFRLQADHETCLYMCRCIWLCLTSSATCVALAVNALICPAAFTSCVTLTGQQTLLSSKRWTSGGSGRRHRLSRNFPDGSQDVHTCGMHKIPVSPIRACSLTHGEAMVFMPFVTKYLINVFRST